jgi:hypothetical protein
MKTLTTWLIMGIMMAVLAYCFVDALEREEFVSQAKAAKRFEALNAQGPYPAPPTGLTPNYGESSEPRIRHYQDASRGRRGE